MTTNRNALSWVKDIQDESYRQGFANAIDKTLEFLKKNVMASRPDKESKSFSKPWSCANHVLDQISESPGITRKELLAKPGSGMFPTYSIDAQLVKLTKQGTIKRVNHQYWPVNGSAVKKEGVHESMAH